jgi:2-methylisocitrate lyase-like PEP mutase family enzyme
MPQPTTDKKKSLRALVERRNALIVPGAANALTARVIEQVGFEAAYVTGAGIANTRFGLPDIGLVTLTEVAETVAAIADVTTLPLVVDADTGFGNALNMIRTVKCLERAGADAIQIEDQLFPKKCGHFSGKRVIPTAEMVAKIKAAVDSRRSEDLLIIARTDARAIEGLDAALDRAQAYVEAGADMTFVEAPTSIEEMATIPQKLAVPQVANMVHGGKTPPLPRDRLAEMGFSIVLYANAALQASLMAMETVLSGLRERGELGDNAALLASFETRQAAVDKPRWDALEETYRE